MAVGIRANRLTAIMVSLAVLALSSVFIYTAYAARQPDMVLKRAMARTLQAGSAHADLEVRSGAAGDPATVFRLAGPVAEPGKFDLVGRYSRDGGRGLGLSLRSIDGRDIYVRLNDVDGLRQVLDADDAAAYGITTKDNPLAKLEGRWLLVPASLKDTVLQNRPSDGKTAYSLSDRERSALAGLYRRHEFVKVSQTLPEEDVDGAPAHHYRLQVDSGRLRSYLQAVRQEIPRLQLSDKQVGSVVATAARITDMEVWINKADVRLSRLQFDTADGKDYQSVRLGLRDFDKPARIDAPAGAVPLFEALGGTNGAN